MDVSVNKLFGLEGDRWMRHANPVSVWTRFAVLPLLALAVWSREWIGWWSLAAVALALVFMMVNPLLFPPPRSTRNWASKGVFGERIWTERGTVELPPQFRSKVLSVTYAIQVVGLAVLVYGLVELDLLAVVSGLVILQTAKAWFIDRMVLLFEHMKGANPEYAAWEYWAGIDTPAILRFMDSSPSQVVGAARDVTPPGSRRSRRRRRPTGEPPPLPRHLETTGVGWLVAAIGLMALSLLVFTAGRYGRGVSFTVVDNWVLERLAARRSPGLTSLMRGLTDLLGTIWTIKVLAWFTVIVLVVYKRFRHLVVGVLSVQLVSLVVIALSSAMRRPRPFGVAIEGSWAGWSMPSRPVAYLSAISVTMLYSLVPKGRWW